MFTQQLKMWSQVHMDQKLVSLNVKLMGFLHPILGRKSLCEPVEENAFMHIFLYGMLRVTGCRAHNGVKK